MNIKGLNITPQMQESSIKEAYILILAISVILLILSTIDFIRLYKDTETDRMVLLRTIGYIIILVMLSLFDKIIGTLYLLKVSVISDIFIIFKLSIILPYVTIVFNVLKIIMYFLNSRTVKK